MRTTSLEILRATPVKDMHKQKRVYRPQYLYHTLQILQIQSVSENNIHKSSKGYTQCKIMIKDTG